MLTAVLATLYSFLMQLSKEQLRSLFLSLFWFNLLHNLKCQAFCTGILLFVPSGIEKPVILSNLNLWSNGYCTIVKSKFRSSLRGLNLKRSFPRGRSNRTFYFGI